MSDTVNPAAKTESSEIPGRWLAFFILLAGMAVHGTMILEAKPLMSANDRSRWCTVWSLVERQTYVIDEIRQTSGWDTIDLVYDDGHFYSTKPPILATWVAGVVWCVTKLTRWSLTKQTQAVTEVTLLIANGVPLLISWILLSRLLRQTVNSAWGIGFLMTVGVFGTLITPFTVTLNNHTVAAAGAMATIYALWKILRTDKPCWGSFVLCGFAAGWTCAHELPAALLGIATFLICGFRDVRKTLIAYVPAAVIPLGFFFLTNWLATGGFKPAYADYGTGKYRFIMEGVPSYWLEPKGIDRNLDSPPVYIFHCLFGHHGLFSLTPVWLLLLPAWIFVWKTPRGCDPSASSPLVELSTSQKPTGSTPSVPSADARALKIISILSLLLTVAILAFYFSRTENYNYGGVCCGLRWALWLTPFWLVTLIPVVNLWGSYCTKFRCFVVPLFLLSAFSAWSRIDNPWQHPWLFKWMEARGKALLNDEPTSTFRKAWLRITTVPNLSEPRPDLPHKLWTWIAAVPDCSDGRPRWMEFVNASPTGVPCRLRLTAQAAPNDSARVHLQITRHCGSNDPETICDVHINRQKMSEGLKPADIVRWPAADVTLDQKQADLAFLRGLPLLKEFRPGVYRYRKTLLRTDAFRCQHAGAQVDPNAPTGGKKLRYRCDVWLCEELPFGIAEVEFQVQDVATGQLLHQERWQAAGCEPPPLPHAQWSPPPD